LGIFFFLTNSPVSKIVIPFLPRQFIVFLSPAPFFPGKTSLFFFKKTSFFAFPDFFS